MSKLLGKEASRALWVALGLVFFLWVIYVAGVVLFPFVVAFGLAYLLDPVIDRMEHMKMSRAFAISLVLFLALFFLVIIISVVAPLIWGQVEALVEKAPGYVQYVESQAAPLIDSIPEAQKEKVKAAIKEGMTNMGDLPLKILSGVSKGIWTGLSSMMGFIIVLFNLIIIPVATFYLLKDYDNIIVEISRRIPKSNRERVFDLFRKIDTALAAFIRGQLVVVSILALILSVGLLVIGTPMGIVIGILAGLANIVPYLSIVVGLAPALLMTYLEYHDITHLVMVFLLFGGAQALEGFVISPNVLEKAVGLHPVAVMAALLVGAHFFGFTGLLLAVPAAAAIKVAVAELDIAYLKSSFYKEDEDK